MLRLTKMGLALLALGTVGLAQAAPVKWQKDFAKAQKVAKQTNRVMVVDFYTTWCGPCKMLDRNTWPAPRVSALLGRAVPVKLDAEAGPNVGIANRYKIRAYPTTLVLSPQGKVLGTIVGYYDAKGMEKELAKYIKPAKRA